MKYKLLFLLLAIIPFIGRSQHTHSFKKKDKVEQGTTAVSFSYKTTTNTASNKSVSSPAPSHIAEFHKPDQKQDEDIKRIIRSKNGTPIFIESAKSPLKSATVSSSEEQFYQFFEKTKTLTSLDNPRNDLIISDSYTDDLGTERVKAFQQYKGIRIYGGELSYHNSETKELFLGRLAEISDDLPILPEIGTSDALENAIADLKQKTAYRELTASQKEMLNYPEPTTELIIYGLDGQAHQLCYEISIRPNFKEAWKYFISAASGEIVFSYNNTQYDGPATATAFDLNGVERTIDTYLEEGSYLLVNANEQIFDPNTGEGIIITLDANNTSTIDLNVSTISSVDNTWNVPNAISAHYNATTTYKYLESTFNRSSINDQGGNIISFVNVTEDDGSSMENAFWNGKAVFYGNGGSSLSSLSGALDVVAHEIGHGVISNTANLEYYGQSGAINESYADIFGAMVDREDWQIGEDVTSTSYISTGALRDMSNPHNGNMDGWQPMHVSEMYLGEEDHAGVHINSGISNYAYYLYATAISKDKAEQVFYHALTNYLSTKSQFIDLRIAVIQSAKDLYGDNSNEGLEASNAFDAVGIYEEEQIDYAQDYPVNNGIDYLLSYDTDVDNPNTLYRSSTNGENFLALSTTIMKSKVSVIDEGTTAIFVSEDSKIHALFTDPSDPDEYTLSDDPFWDNVAISKDGNRVACISIEIDTAIYVYDFVSEEWAKFRLYNPTTSHSGGDAGGVLYADAIAFDHTGEFVMYDAYNELASSTEDAISYWDIGFVKVWDNENNTFADGEIMKLFGTLPEDVSVGNPVFSQNSPHIIAFDYWDANTNEYFIIGSNLLNDDLGIITENTRLGYPSYSKLDDRISYTAYNASDEDIIAVIDLAQNKISSTGDPSALVPDAIWPVYYATGTRGLALAPVSNFTADSKSGNAPLTVQFIDLSINSPNTWNWTFEGGSPASSEEQNPSVLFENEGVFQVSLTCSNDAGSNAITKTAYISVTGSTGIDQNITPLISIFPNPVHERLNIDCDKPFDIRIFNHVGSKTYEGSNHNQIDLSNYQSGLYIIQIEVSGKVLNHRIVKR